MQNLTYNFTLNKGDLDLHNFLEIFFLVSNKFYFKTFELF